MPTARLPGATPNRRADPYPSDAEMSVPIAPSTAALLEGHEPVYQKPAAANLRARIWRALVAFATRLLAATACR